MSYQNQNYESKCLILLKDLRLWKTIVIKGFFPVLYAHDCVGYIYFFTGISHSVMDDLYIGYNKGMLKMR